MKKIEPKSYFWRKGFAGHIDFENGALISDTIDLSREETKQLFLSMRNYYIINEPEFVKNIEMLIKCG